MEHATPTYLLTTEDGTPLGAASLEWIRSVGCDCTCDGADVLTVDCDAWDPIKANFRMLDERPLFPGNKVILWGGYGPAIAGSPDLRCFGKFLMDSREPSYDEGGVGVTFVGYDGLQRMMECKDARVIEKTRVSDVVEELARIYDFDIDTVPTPPLPPTADLNAPLRLPKRSVEPTKKLPLQEYCKRRGVTDLAWLKGLAEMVGYGYPKVRYNPKTGREVLVFRPPAQGPDAWTQTWWYRKPGGDGSLLQFRPAFSKDAPIGVEIVGWDRANGVPIRVIARVRPGSEPDIKTTKDVILGDKIQSEIRSGAALRLSVIGSGDQVVRLKPVRVGKRVWTPEASTPEELTRDLVSGSPDWTVQDIEAIARAYISDRSAAWWTATFKLENQPGLHLLDSDQVHEFRGLAGMDEGHFITLRAQHRWEGDRHSVEGNGQRLIEEDGQIEIIEQPWGNA